MTELPDELPFENVIAINEAVDLNTSTNSLTVVIEPEPGKKAYVSVSQNGVMYPETHALENNEQYKQNIITAIVVWLVHFNKTETFFTSPD